MKTALRIDYNAPFSLTFALISMAVLLLAGLSNGWVLQHVFSIPGNAGFGDWSTYPRLFLHVFGHGSPEHLFSNIILLLLLGPMLEKAYGISTLVMVSAITAVVTGLLMILLFSGLLLGGSGVLFALIVLSSFANARRGTIPLTFIFVSLIFLGGEVLQAFQGQQTGIAHFAHLAGGAVGGLAGFFLSSSRMGGR